MEGFDRAALIAFWQRWYFPANAVLYIVGDFDRPIEGVKALINAAFGAIPPGREPLPEASAASSSPSSSSSNGNGNGSAHGAVADAATSSSSGSRNGSGDSSRADQQAALGPLKQKHKVGLFPCCLVHRMPCHLGLFLPARTGHTRARLHVLSSAEDTFCKISYSRPDKAVIVVSAGSC